jgi:hypothetical protein
MGEPIEIQLQCLASQHRQGRKGAILRHLLQAKRLPKYGRVHSYQWLINHIIPQRTTPAGAWEYIYSCLVGL